MWGCTLLRDCPWHNAELLDGTATAERGAINGWAIAGVAIGRGCPAVARTDAAWLILMNKELNKRISVWKESPIEVNELESTLEREWGEWEWATVAIKLLRWSYESFYGSTKIFYNFDGWQTHVCDRLLRFAYLSHDQWTYIVVMSSSTGEFFRKREKRQAS